MTRNYPRGNDRHQNGATEEQGSICVRDLESYRKWLLWLHEDYSWGVIADVIGIPPGTLWDVAHGKPMPRKWRVPVFRDLLAMPIAELRWALENRYSV